MRKFRLRTYLRWTYVVLFSLVASIASSQDCQAIYNQAIEQYKLEDYQKSISLAENAVEKSKTQTINNRAYTLQLVTTNCIMLNDADRGLKFIDEEIKLFQQIEGQKSKSLAEAMKKQILFLQQKGMIGQAREKWKPAMKVFEESYGGEAFQTTLLASLHAELDLVNED